MEKFELIVIGTGPAGEKAAVKAAYFGHKVAIIEKEAVFGGAEVVTGTLPSKTLRETALYFSGKYERGLYGVERELEHAASINDFLYRKEFVCKAADQEIKENLHNHGVKVYRGQATFEDPHILSVNGEKIYGDYILIATGSCPYHPPHIPFDAKRVCDSDTILHITHLPSSLCIVGAGVIGCEYATIFSTMGTKVYLVNDKEKILGHIDQEVADELVTAMQSTNIEILFNKSVESLTVPLSDETPLRVTLKSKEVLNVDMFLFAAGRNGNIQNLQCEKIGIQTNPRQNIIVNTHYQTNIPHIYAAGDVIGFPALASTSMEQGRLAVAHMFKTQDLETLPAVLPLGIYTVPEISLVGITEEDALARNLEYCIGKARYPDMARGKIMGCTSGFLKLIFLRETLTIMGVHIIGNIASELIHYGVILVEEKKNLYNVISQVFNYPTLHDLYKYAAYDGLGNHSGHKIKH